jgi:hypothetical protein
MQPVSLAAIRYTKFQNQNPPSPFVVELPGHVTVLFDGTTSSKGMVLLGCSKVMPLDSYSLAAIDMENELRQK